MTNRSSTFLSVFTRVFVAILPVVAIFLTQYACDTYAQESSDQLLGTGEPADPYQLDSFDKLSALEKYPTAYFVLTQDLRQGDLPFAPLCAQNGFAGVLDGNGHSIEFHYAAQNDQEALGLFTKITQDGYIKRLTVSGSLEVNAQTRYVGAIAGESYGTLFNVTSSVVIDVSKAHALLYAGGLVGYSQGILVSCAAQGGIVANERVVKCEQEAITNGLRPENRPFGLFIGACGPVASNRLPKNITAHAGFAAPGGVKDSSQDNTLENIANALKYKPDMIEIDVRLNDQGELVVTHNYPIPKHAPTLQAVLTLLLGKPVDGVELPEYDPQQARAVKLQLDAKQNGIVLQELETIEKVGFPLNRIIMAGDSNYDTVYELRDAIRDATEQGMEFWMNPDRLDSYEHMTKRDPKFIERITAFDLPCVTVNSSYTAMNDAIVAWLRANDVQISIWTLNSDDAIRNNLTLGVYNATSRSPQLLQAREACQRNGLWDARVGDQLQTNGAALIPNLEEVGARVQEKRPAELENALNEYALRLLNLTKD
ncbi:MAG: glycerophosphodiester phosphodiesterase [Planctomycetia bacterium]|nr:glycerophosphodiester phosphodiesterase [Planctomycetia bacterium]